MLDIDKLIQKTLVNQLAERFSSMLDIDKLIPDDDWDDDLLGFSSMLDIDKLILYVVLNLARLSH